MSWKECNEEFSVITIKPDKEKAKSILETANARIKYANKDKIDKTNCSFIFESYYSALIEYLHSILIRTGFKAKNHICLGYYLRDVLKRDELYRIFDYSRKRRNNLMYYGKMLKFETAKKSIENVKILIKELIHLNLF